MAKSREKSAFVSSLTPKRDILKEASQAQRTSITDASEVIEAYDLQDGDRMSIACKLTSCIADVHKEEGDKKGLPFVNFLYAPTEEPGKGMTIGAFFPGYDRRELEITVDSWNWIYREFQGFGFDTAEWSDDPSKVEEAAKELTAEKPLCMVQIRCSKIRSGDRKGELALNYGISRVLDSDEEGEVETTPVVSSSSMAPPKAGNKGKAKETVPTAPEPQEVTIPEPPAPEASAPAKRGRAKKVANVGFEIGDKVKFKFENDDGEDEIITGTITALSLDDASNLPTGDFEITDGTYSYTMAPSDLTKVS